MNGSFSTYIHPKLYFEFGVVQLKLIEERLIFFEEKLKLYSKKKQINDIIDLIDDRKAKRIIRDLF